MGFFFDQLSIKKDKFPIKTAHELECRICTLQKCGALNSGLKPKGDENPLVYLLSLSPENEDDVLNDIYKGEAGKFVNSFLPKDLKEFTRYNYIVRTYTPGDRIPTELEIECCRPSIIKDIEKSKPKIIIGFGSEVLNWVLQESSIFKWRGRLIPIKIGNHKCWFFPMFSFFDILKKSKFNKNGDVIKNEYHQTFKQDFEFVLNELEKGLEEVVFEEDDFLSNVVCTEGLKSDVLLEKVVRWLGLLEKEEIVGIDIETNQLRPYIKNGLFGKILTISIGNEKNVYSFPLEYPNCWTNKQSEILSEALLKFLLNKNVLKIAHNLKFEQEWLAYRFGNEILNTKWGDTQAQAYLLDERRQMHTLDVLVRLNYGFWLKSLSNLDRSKMESYSVDKILPYNGLDTKYTCSLYKKQSSKINKNLLSVYNHLIKVTTSLTLMQLRGVVLNLDYCEKSLTELSDELKIIESEIKQLPEVILYEKKYSSFNCSSPEQVLSVLKVIFKLEKELLNEKGTYSADEATLSKLNNDFSSLILKHRAISKKKSTYVEPMFEHVFDDGNLHTNFNPYITTTGRLSSNGPNMQNFPNRKGKEIRQMIIAPKNHFIVCADYGQIEARLIGAASQDEKFIEYLWNPKSDVHLDWAIKISEAYPKVFEEEMYENIEESKRLKTFRGYVKNQWIFPAFYGSSIYSIASTLKLPKDVANDLFNEFWKTFAGVKEWQQWIMSFYRKNGFVESLYGRRRRNPLSFNEAINSTIQATASDICTEAMCELIKLGIKVILNVHDDITSYVHDDLLEKQVLTIAQTMCSISKPWLNIPLSVEISYGEDWYNQKAIDTFLSTDFIKVDKNILPVGYYRKFLNK